MKKLGYNVSVSDDGVVLSVNFGFDDVESAVAYATGGAESDEEAKPAKGKRGAKAAAEEKPAKGGKGKGRKPKDEDEEEEEEEAEEEESEEEESEDEEEEEEEESEDEEEEEEDEKPAKGGKSIKITDDLKKATKLREVIVALQKQGLKSKKDLTAAVLKLKTKLKVLQAISDLETRIPRAIELVSPDAK